MRLEQKLTMRALGWTRGKIEEAIGAVPRNTGRVLLGRVAGIAVGTKLAKDVNDDVIVGLKGSFRGVSSQSGEMVTSGVCYLPSGIQGMIESSLSDAKRADPNATVQFVVDVFAIPAQNKAGYSFNADNVAGDMNVEADPLTELLGKATELVALPPPLNPPAKEEGKEKETESQIES